MNGTPVLYQAVLAKFIQHAAPRKTRLGTGEVVVAAYVEKDAC
jgi:hypothetical protein